MAGHFKLSNIYCWVYAIYDPEDHMRKHLFSILIETYIIIDLIRLYIRLR